MNIRTHIIAGLAAVLAAAAPGTAGAVTCLGATGDTLVSADTNLETGHYFEVYRADGIGWGDANHNASGRSCDGATGHLATITSSGEEAFVDALRHNAWNASGLLQPQAWIGGFKDGNGVWQWVNNEGPFPADNSGPGYANWALAFGEPNNAGGVENSLALGRYDSGNPWVDNGWNDEGSAPTSIGGYVVEYDVPRAAACSGASCQTIDGQTLIFPPGSIPPGATIGFKAYEFSDPRVAAGRCDGTTPLTLFGAAYGMPELRIPAYLCGSPKFVVVAVDSSQLAINSGTVYVENRTDVVLPGNQYQCTDPIVQNYPTQGDPQFQDVVVWQSTDPTRMLEDGQGTGVFAGAAGEFTSFCGSSGAKVKGASYFVVGLHVDFGAGYDWATNPAGNHQRFVDLTLYKLSLLRQSITDAYAAGSIRKVDAALMTGLVDVAVKALYRGQDRAALLSVRLFLALVNVTRYKAIPSQNYNGEHLMRGTNIEFTLRVKVVPYGP